MWESVHQTKLVLFIVGKEKTKHSHLKKKNHAFFSQGDEKKTSHRKSNKNPGTESQALS